MQNLIQFIIKYGYLGLFLLLEAISFGMIVNYNQSQREIWINSAHLATSSINAESQKLKNYFRLTEINDSLALVNAELIEQIVNYKVYSKDNAYQKFVSKDTLPYKIIPAAVSTKTVGYRNNFFTINKGWNHGIMKDMGVISSNGIVGTIMETSKNFSKVLLINNQESLVSASIKGKGYFGNMRWGGVDYTKMMLEAIPKFAKVEIGDTIITSGYSTIFPKNMFIGTVSAFEIKEGSNNYQIEVDLYENVTLLDYVYIIDDEYHDELNNIISNSNLNE